MGVARARTVSLHGASGHLIDVQVDVSNGMVATAMVGRADTSIAEARDRCRSAVLNSGGRWPSSSRITILLSPTDLPKRGPHFDLAIAIAVMSAGVRVNHKEDLPLPIPDDHVFIGELGLDGRLRPVPGVLPMAIAAARRGLRTVVVAEPQVAEAALVPGLTVIGARSLAQVVALLRGETPPEAEPVEDVPEERLLHWRGQDRHEEVDLADVRGSADARFALEVAAAGGHHLLLTGPKGSGKTMLAERLPTLLPDLTLDEALEVSALHSLSGRLPRGASMIERPVFCAPHHSSSRSSVLGGGSGRVAPGEVSRAHLGVLFLDEFPLFNVDVVEGLREPLENGDVYLARGEETATFPARALVVLAANPCPCGQYTATGLDQCECSPTSRRTYRRKLEGPVVDRIDIRRRVDPPGRGASAAPETSAAVRGRVLVARSRQAARYLEMPWRLNAHAPGPALERYWPLPAPAQALLEEQVASGRLTRRGGVRVHRLALTLADLRGEAPDADDVDVAIRLREGDPLPLHRVERVPVP